MSDNARKILSAVLLLFTIATLIGGIINVTADRDKTDQLFGSGMMDFWNVLVFAPGLGGICLFFGDFKSMKVLSMIGAAFVIVPIAFPVSQTYSLLGYNVKAHQYILILDEEGAEDCDECEQALTGSSIAIASGLFAMATALTAFVQKHPGTGSFISSLKSQHTFWKALYGVALVLSLVGGILIWSAQAQSDDEDDANDKTFWYPSLGTMPWILFAFSLASFRLNSAITMGATTFLASQFVAYSVGFYNTVYYINDENDTKHIGTANAGLLISLIGIMTTTLCILLYSPDRISNEAGNVRKEFEERVYSHLGIQRGDRTHKSRVGLVRLALTSVCGAAIAVSFFVSLDNKLTDLLDNVNLRANSHLVRASLAISTLAPILLFVGLFLKQSANLTLAFGLALVYGEHLMSEARSLNIALDSLEAVLDDDSKDYLQTDRNISVTCAVALLISLIAVTPLPSQLSTERTFGAQHSRSRVIRRIVMSLVFLLFACSVWWYGCSRQDGDNDLPKSTRPVGTIFTTVAGIYACLYRSLLATGAVVMACVMQMIILFEYLLVEVDVSQRDSDNPDGWQHVETLRWGLVLLIFRNFWTLVRLLLFTRHGVDNNGAISNNTNSHHLLDGGDSSSSSSSSNRSGYISPPSYADHLRQGNNNTHYPRPPANNPNAV